MQNLDQHTITEAVLARHAKATDPRLRAIVTSLVQHLHAFAREVGLTEQEWFQGIVFLTRCGHITDDKRQEFILLSDVLGLSMLTVAMNNRKPEGCTEATVVGPFHVEGAPRYEMGADISNGARGVPCQIRGTIRGADGSPVANAHIDVWQSDEKGLYDVQHAGIDHAQAQDPEQRRTGPPAPAMSRRLRAAAASLRVRGAGPQVLECQLPSRGSLRPQSMEVAITIRQ